VTAHNRDDQAETILYRLTKYASPRGLVGMRPRDGGVARPLLCVGSTEIRSYCGERGIAYGEDVTNLESAYARNLIRLEVLPPLRQINPRVTETLAAAGDIADAEAEVVDCVADEVMRRVSRDDGEWAPVLDVAALREHDDALVSVVLHRWLRAAYGSESLVERRLVTAVRRLLERPRRGGRTTLRGDLEAVCDGGLLKVNRAQESHVCEEAVIAPARLRKAGAGGIAVTFCGRRLRARLLAATPRALPLTQPHEAHIGFGRLPQRITLRHPRRGDRFGPSGLGAETTVLRYLSAARVPRAGRSRALVVDVDARVAWVGFRGGDGCLRGRVAEAFKVDKSSAWTLHLAEEDA
jgi:tRNA(Ile)-lysidine synthase